MNITQKNNFIAENEFSLSSEQIKELEKTGVSKKLEDEDVRLQREQKNLHLVFIRKFFADSRSGSDFKQGNDYLEFVNNEGNIIHIRKTKIMWYPSFKQNDYYYFKLNKRGQVNYVLSKDIEVFNRGGNIISHDFYTDRYYNHSRYYEVDNNFKPL